MNTEQFIAIVWCVVMSTAIIGSGLVLVEGLHYLFKLFTKK
jgi:hypothetical protein